jgi:hypothetical protein
MTHPPMSDTILTADFVKVMNRLNLEAGLLPGQSPIPNI